MRKIVTLTLFIALALTNAKAQVPGFEGTKLSVYYSGDLYPRIFSIGYKDPTNVDPPYFGINYRHNFDADYVVTRRTAVGASLKLLSTGTMGFNASYSAYVPQASGYVDYSLKFSNININTKIVTVYIKDFSFEKSGSIAPVGTYQKFELGLGFSETSSKAAELSSFDYYTGFRGAEKVPYKKYNPGTIKSLMFFYTVGQQHLLAKRIYIDYGLGVGLTPLTLGKAYKYLRDDVDELYNDEADIDSEVKFRTEYRLLRHVLLNVHIGTGILLF